MKPTILVILGSTREGRRGETVATWLMQRLETRSDATFTLVDLRDYSLLDLDGQRWIDTVAAADGYVIITPKYNHRSTRCPQSRPRSRLREWNRKPVAFVSYGGHAAGYRAVEQLRLVAIELQLAPIREQLGIQAPWDAFDADGTLNQPGAEEAVGRLTDVLLWWARALQVARATSLTQPV